MTTFRVCGRAPGGGFIAACGYRGYDASRALPFVSLCRAHVGFGTA